jgi:hypothetical protein
MLRFVTACDGKCYGLSFHKCFAINTCYGVTVWDPCDCLLLLVVDGFAAPVSSQSSS